MYEGIITSLIKFYLYLKTGQMKQNLNEHQFDNNNY